MSLPVLPIPIIPTPVAVCTGLWCVIAKYWPDLSDVSLMVGIVVGLSVIALNIKKFFNDG